jgi:hypothetical protein
MIFEIAAGLILSIISFLTADLSLFGNLTVGAAPNLKQQSQKDLAED